MEVQGRGRRVLVTRHSRWSDLLWEHIVDPENSDTSEGWHRELRLLLGDAASEIKTIRFEYPRQFQDLAQQSEPGAN